MATLGTGMAILELENSHPVFLVPPQAEIRTIERSDVLILSPCRF